MSSSRTQSNRENRFQLLDSICQKKIKTTLAKLKLSRGRLSCSMPTSKTCNLKNSVTQARAKLKFHRLSRTWSIRNNKYMSKKPK